MGCTSSTESAAVDTSKDDRPTARTIGIHEKKREKEDTAGTEIMAGSAVDDDASREIVTTKTGAKVLGDISIRYACGTKRGRDPDNASKPNQDCYGLGCNGAFLGVYDGHGPHGDACSQFVQLLLPELAQKRLDDNFYNHDASDVQEALRKAHTECNDKLHAAGINDTYSGTTAITVFIDEGRITVCNVGDSRAVLGSIRGDGRLKAVPLSKDQTPHRSDEATRCVKAGARILSFGEIDPSTQEEGDSDVEDPPRVWSRKGNFPGTAFTRSFGDSVAEEIGVFAEPEMLTLKLTPNERLVVLASDGVFDVMENQEVVDLCVRYKDDPKQACSAVIEKSHLEWLRNEECVDEESASYDDITIICIFFGDTEDVSPPPSTPQPQHRLKRVRQKTLRNLEDMENQ